MADRSFDIELLRRMVAIPSVSGQEQELAGFLVREMAARGFRAHVDEAGNAVGELGEGPAEILLLGHMDTAPGTIPVREEGGAIYGRGAVDAKGALAAFITAATCVGPLPGLRLTVVGAVEEEAASSRGARHLLGHRPAMAIIGEPSGWERITLGYKGRLLVDVRCEQPMAHSAGPEVGAAERVIELWLAVRGYAEGYNRDRERRFDRLDPSLRAIRSESDGLRERAEATIGLRLPPGLEPAQVQAELARLVSAPVEVSFRGAEQAYLAPKSSPLVAALLAGIRAAGGRPAFSLKTGTSDMNVVGPVWGCPIAAYGPGDSALDHTPGEHLELAEYGRAIEALARALTEIAQRI